MSIASTRSRRRWFLYGAVALILAAGVWYFSIRKKPSGNRWGPNPTWAGNGPMPAMPVRVVPAERRDLPVHLKAIGTATPPNTVTVRSRVDGQLLRMDFQEGQHVEAGTLLAEVDPEPYRIQLAQAEARCRQNAAQLDTARADLARLEPLYERNLVTIQQLEAQRALVRERESIVAADQASVDEAKLQLAYTRIEAPIAGRIGLRRIDPGNLVRANDANGLVTITQTRPMAVVFTIPEVDLPQVLEAMRSGEPPTVAAWDRSEKALLASGVLRTLDNQIDTATGTIRLKAEFPNDDETLFPNQFVNVRLHVRTIRDAVVIPAAAVQFGSRGTYVFVVNDKNQASVRAIHLGAAEGDVQTVESGLNPGDPVVLEGIDRLREGRPVVVVDESGAQVPAAVPAAPAVPASAAAQTAAAP